MTFFLGRSEYVIYICNKKEDDVLNFSIAFLIFKILLYFQKHCEYFPSVLFIFISYIAFENLLFFFLLDNNFLLFS
jgi:hypothetical protein